MIRHLHYFWRLARSLFTPQRDHKSRLVVALPCAVLVLAVAGALRSPATALGIEWEKKSKIDQLIERTQAVDVSLQTVEGVYEEEIKPIERVLLHYRNDARVVRRIAAALVKEGRRAEIAPDLLLAVLLVENPWLDPSAQSPVGARGLMQVMPGHRGNWKACTENMDSIEGNICYGAQIFRDYLRTSNGNYEKALLRYNGCVRGTNTPNCKAYADHVFARAGRATFLSKGP